MHIWTITAVSKTNKEFLYQIRNVNLTKVDSCSYTLTPSENQKKNKFISYFLLVHHTLDDVLLLLRMLMNAFVRWTKQTERTTEQLRKYFSKNNTYLVYLVFFFVTYTWIRICFGGCLSILILFGQSEQYANINPFVNWNCIIVLHLRTFSCA